MAAALISTIAIATADLIVAKITAVVYFFKEILNAVRSVFMLFFTNPILFLAIVFVLVGSIFWLPYHHIGFEVIQIVHTDIVRPLARDVLHPAVAAIAPVYEDIASWINFLYFTFRRFLFDMLILPLRCARLPEFVRALINSVLPFARFVVIVARMSGRALLGQSVPNEMPAVAVGLLFDDIANVTDATGGITDCYCAAVSYYFDFGVLLFRDRDIQCSFANMLGFAQEFLARSIRFLISILYYLSTVLKWLLCLFFSGLSSGACVPGEFPFPNATQLLPNIDILLDRTEAAACCGGDAIDNIVNTAVDTAVDIANTIGLHPLDKNITPPGFWKVSAPIKVS